ncbi:MAG: FtsX-like permease family protein, partial [Aristaeellaceae bacterium]
KTVCAVLVRSKSIADYSTLTAAYSDNSDYLVINPNTVLREVLENVDMSRRIVYILCAVILIMNVFVITLIALLSAYDSRSEISLMRLIGVSMGKINLLYLIENAVAGAIALALSLLAAHGCLLGIRSFVAGMGIVLNAAKIYPAEWAILLLVFAVSILPTSIMTLRMSRRDGVDR